MGKQIKMLKHHTHFLSMNIDIRLLVCDIRSFEENLASGGNLQKVQAAQESRLAGAGGTDDYHHLPLVDIQGYPVQGVDVSLLKVLLHMFGCNDCISAHCF